MMMGEREWEEATASGGARERDETEKAFEQQIRECYKTDPYAADVFVEVKTSAPVAQVVDHAVGAAVDTETEAPRKKQADEQEEGQECGRAPATTAHSVQPRWDPNNDDRGPLFLLAQHHWKGLLPSLNRVEVVTFGAPPTLPLETARVVERILCRKDSCRRYENTVDPVPHLCDTAKGWLAAKAACLAHGVRAHVGKATELHWLEESDLPETGMSSEDAAAAEVKTGDGGVGASSLDEDVEAGRRSAIASASGSDSAPASSGVSTALAPAPTAVSPAGSWSPTAFLFRPSRSGSWQDVVDAVSVAAETAQSAGAAAAEKVQAAAAYFKEQVASAQEKAARSVTDTKTKHAVQHYLREVVNLRLAMAKIQKKKSVSSSDAYHKERALRVRKIESPTLFRASSTTRTPCGRIAEWKNCRIPASADDGISLVSLRERYQDNVQLFGRDGVKVVVERNGNTPAEKDEGQTQDADESDLGQNFLHQCSLNNEGGDAAAECEFSCNVAWSAEPIAKNVKILVRVSNTAMVHVCDRLVVPIAAGVNADL